MPRLRSNNRFRLDYEVGTVIRHDCEAGSDMRHDCWADHDCEAGTFMCHDYEAGAVFATTVKQELLSPRLRSRNC
jgi:hypothetical protein